MTKGLISWDKSTQRQIKSIDEESWWVKEVDWVREAFKKYLQKTYGIFHIKGGGGSGGVIFHMFSATHQNAFKAILSIFRHFYFFPLRKSF